MINPIILIVEDSDSVRRSLREWLEGAFPAYEVIETDTGEKALTITQARAPRIVIMDISLPGISGIEAMKQIKATTSTTQVVVLTVHEEKTFRDDAIAAGASAFVTKRMMQKELLPTLMAILTTEYDAKP